MPTSVAIVPLCAMLAVTGAVLATGDVSAFVGSDRCASCHPSAAKVWQASAHARAQQALDPKQAADPRCTQCHGVTAASTGGVQCESCHGAGRTYARRFVMKDKVLSRLVGLEDPSETTCRRCHTDNNPSIRPFDFDSKWIPIRHGLEKKQAEAAP